MDIAVFIIVISMVGTVLGLVLSCLEWQFQPRRFGQSARKAAPIPAATLPAAAPMFNGLTTGSQHHDYLSRAA